MPRAPFVRGSATSEGGADFIEPHRESIAERIWNHLAGIPTGLTCAETESALSVIHQTASARFNELTEAGCLQPAGTYRGTPPSEVYVVVPGVTFDRYRAWVRSQKAGKKSSKGEALILAASRAWVASDGQEHEDEAREALLDAVWACYGPTNRAAPHKRGE